MNSVGTGEAVMAEPHLDHPGDVHWFKGHGPLKVLALCSHNDCPHDARTVIAWGPDMARYELVTCDVADGCAGTCRAWIDGKGVTSAQWLWVGEGAVSAA